MKTTSALSPVETRLLALIETERSGPEIAALYRKETGTRIARGTFYTSMRRLRRRSLVRMRLDRYGDQRTRLFAATDEGRTALAESRARYLELAKFGLDQTTA